MANPLERISARIASSQVDAFTFEPTPLLTLAEFFDGNEVTGSIWCNVFDPARPDWAPAPAHARAAFESIIARPDVADVRIEISMFDDPDWPFADTALIVTTATPEVVATWFDPLTEPSDTGLLTDRSGLEPLDVPPDHHVVWCWWD